MKTAPYVDASQFHVPGSNNVNYGAAYNHQLLVQEERARHSKPADNGRQAYEDKVQKTYDLVIKPRTESRFAAGTARSTAAVLFQGKTYTLPANKSSVKDDWLKFSDQYGGLHGTNEMHQALEASLVNLFNHNRSLTRENQKEEKKSGRIFFKSSKPVTKFELVSDEHVYRRFAILFAESRVPIDSALVRRNDGLFERAFTHPSSESGNFHAEMQAWSNAHWQGVAEVKDRDWSKEILTSFPRNKIAA